MASSQLTNPKKNDLLSVKISNYTNTTFTTWVNNELSPTPAPQNIKSTFYPAVAWITNLRMYLLMSRCTCVLAYKTSLFDEFMKIVNDLEHSIWSCVLQCILRHDLQLMCFRAKPLSNNIGDFLGQLWVFSYTIL